MAEARGSGEESSEEEEHDEVSPSLSGPVSPNTADSTPHTNKKKLRYFRDYLQRLPEHQRWRIQEEIKKGYKPGETHCYVDYPLLKKLIMPIPSKIAKLVESGGFVFFFFKIV